MGDTVDAAIKRGIELLKGAGVDSPDVDARLFAAHLLGTTPAMVQGQLRRELTFEQATRLGEWFRRRAGREPLQHIINRAFFYGLELYVDQRVLIPRPETERLVELALEAATRIEEPRFLDVGTGSGAMALAIKHHRPDAMVVASDNDLAALNVARRNAANLALQVAFQQADLLDDATVSSFARLAHVIVCNPPYLPESDRDLVPPEVRSDPPAALFAGPDGLAQFRRLVPAARRLMSPGSVLLVELDPRNIAVAKSQLGVWAEVQEHCDLAGRRRFLKLVR